VIYVPIVVFLGAVLWAIGSPKPTTRSGRNSPVTIAGAIGLASVALSAYFIGDHSRKVVADTNELAIAFLVAHAVLYFGLVLKAENR
jgi:hypothetical protein